MNAFFDCWVVNKQSLRIRRAERPEEQYPVLMSIPGCMKLCAVSEALITGPYFYDNVIGTG